MLLNKQKKYQQSLLILFCLNKNKLKINSLNMYNSIIFFFNPLYINVIFVKK